MRRLRRRVWTLLATYGWLLSYALLYLALHLFVVEGLHLPLPWALLFFFVVLVADRASELRPEVAARLYTARRGVSLALGGTSLLVGGLLIWIALTRHTEQIGTNELISFCLQGVLVGVVFRVLLTAYFTRMLQDAPIEVARALVLLVLSIFIALFPTSESHRSAAGVFTIGTGLGFLLHYAVRRKEHLQASSARLMQNLLSGLHGDHEELWRSERAAAQAFADRDRSALLRIFDGETKKSSRLELVKAADLRHRGQYLEALDVLKGELVRPDRQQRDVPLQGLLHLQMALNYGELDQKVEMREALAAAERHSIDCLLTQVTIALRDAEEVSVDDARYPVDFDDPTDVRTAPLRRMWRALHLHERMARSSMSSWSLITGSTIPVTWTFLLDSYAYVLMKAGRLRFAKSLFEHCVYVDPTFASPYVHLGEMHLILARSAGGPSHARLANMCLRIGMSLQGRRQTLLKRRAELLLDIAKSERALNQLASIRTT